MPSSKPWAFDNNPQWNSFLAKLKEADLSLRRLNAWRLTDANVRGDNWQLFAIYGPEVHGRPLIGSIIVCGYGPDGFSLWFDSTNSKMEDDVQTLIRRAKLRHETIKDAGFP